LDRILTHYAEKLSACERDLLVRLSAFPRGVTLDLLALLGRADSQVAGSLAGRTESGMALILDQLRQLGLGFRHATAAGPAYSAPPFLRDYFRDLLGVTSPEQIHEVVRQHLETSLRHASPQHHVTTAIRTRGTVSSPLRRPTEPAMLDRYEALIEHTRL